MKQNNDNLYRELALLLLKEEDLRRKAGPELKRKSYELGAQKRINQQNKNLIKNLTEQLLDVTNFYQNQLVPTLKATIQAQQDNIEELLQQMPWADKGGK